MKHLSKYKYLSYCGAKYELTTKLHEVDCIRCLVLKNEVTTTNVTKKKTYRTNSKKRKIYT